MDGRLDGAHEARAHVDAAGAEAQRGREALPVGEAARGDEGDLEGLPRAREEDEVGYVGFSYVAVFLGEGVGFSMGVWALLWGLVSV